MGVIWTIIIGFIVGVIDGTAVFGQDSEPTTAIMPAVFLFIARLTSRLAICWAGLILHFFNGHGVG